MCIRDRPGLDGEYHHDGDNHFAVAHPPGFEPLAVQELQSVLDAFDVVGEEEEQHQEPDDKQRDDDRDGCHGPFVKGEAEPGRLPQHADRQRGARAAEEGGDPADDAPPGDAHEQELAVASPFTGELQALADFGNDGKHHGRHRMLAHDEGKESAQQVHRQRQPPGRSAEGGEHASGEAGGKARPRHGGRQDERTEDEEDRLVAEHGIGLLRIHYSQQGDHRHRHQGGHRQRQQARHPEEDGRGEKYHRVIPLE